MTRFEGTTPILRVESLSASIKYYTDVLGFKLDWEDQGIFASVSRGGCCLFLSEGDQGHPGSWVWVGVDDAGRCFDELRAKGARIRHAPTNYKWTYEVQVEDLDGNVLRLGSEPRSTEPIGEWLDMNGRRWVPKPEGGWQQVEDDNPAS